MAATEPPTGTITFLFTDIEGSTRLTQDLGSGWPPLLERHRHIARTSWVQHGGVEISTEGDSFFVVFESAASALAAVVQAQRDLAAEPWPESGVVRVRMGLHTGEGQLSGGSYVGLDVHRAARIACAGHGGEVLLSGATYALVENHLPDGVGVRDLGEHQLKDLSRPERIWELTIGGLRTAFPPLKTLDAVQNNLPSQLTSFLGREREIAEARQLLAESRLLTLTGPGGTGKTRLALQTAADAADRYPDGMYFVGLGMVNDAALVLPTIAQVVGIAEPGGLVRDRLISYVGTKSVLLILDNFEQVAGAAPEIGDLLQSAPHLSVLVTSRSPLRAYGEREFHVPALGLPDPRNLPGLDELARCDSVALFVERARDVQADFQLRDTNAAAVAEICARLDGLPLAIELAAARVRVLSPRAIAERLDHRLALLSGGARDLPERQQTLRGAIAWSYDLLDEDEQRFFSRFGVFVGGANLSAVEQVVFEPDKSAEALDAVDSLLEKSLLRQETPADGEPRYAMLETIREFALQQLDEHAELGLLSERHATWVVDFVEREERSVFGEDRGAVLDRYEIEHDNIRAALSWSIASSHDELAMRIFTSTWRFWQSRGFLTEARRQAERVMALPHGAEYPGARARAAEAAGGIAYWQADMDASAVWYAEALELARAAGDERGLANALYNMSFPLTRAPGKKGEALSFGHEALDIFRRLGDEEGVGRVLWGMCSAYYYNSDIEGGMPVAREALEILERGDDTFMTAWAQYMLGVFNLTVDPQEMRLHLLEASRLFAQTNDKSGHTLVLDAFATLAWQEGDVARAMRLAGYAGAAEKSTGAGLGKLSREQAGFFPETLMDDPELAQAYEEGRRLTVSEANALALLEEVQPGPDA